MMGVAVVEAWELTHFLSTRFLRCDPRQLQNKKILYVTPLSGGNNGYTQLWMQV